MKRRKSLGIAFADQLINLDRSGHRKKTGAENEEWSQLLFPNYQPREVTEPASVWRLVFLGSIFIICFFGLFLRLFHLQVVQGEENRGLADSNRIQMRVIHAPRGVIFDRNGKVLAETNPAFRLGKDLISRDEALALEAKDDPVVGELEVDAVRYYPLGILTAHLLGYVGQISEDELKLPQYQNYRTGDRIGRSGIEQIYEQVLRGRDGAEVIEVDASGRKLRTLRRVEPIPGSSVRLSIDADLQKKAYEALKKGVTEAGSCCGALVAENPYNGEVLTLVSYPGFDANAFTDPKKNNQVEEYFSDSNSPLLNRVIAGVYPPGSTFKISSALAGLSSGKISKETRFEDTGVLSLGPYKFANWYFTQYGRTEGAVDLVKALQRSNDIFFYKVGEAVGEVALGETAKKIGLGKKLGIDLPDEVSGLIPSDNWKRENFDQPWYPGDSLHMAIGQGFVLTTPLQIMAQTAFVAASGQLVIPHLATTITSPEGILVKRFNFEPVVKDVFKAEDIKLVKQGLSLVPKDGGTAWPFFNFSIPTAGKTGTAEFGDPKGNTHAWYTSYAPVEDPQIVITVLIEAGGEGSSIASPVVKDVYNWYFNSDKNNLKNLDVAPVATASARQLGE